MDIRLNKGQEEFVNAYDEAVALVAGYGSGKTQVALIKMISQMLEYPKADMAYFAPTYQLINDIWYPKVEEFCNNLGLGFKIDKARDIIRVSGAGKIYCRTMNKPENIIGFEAVSAYLDEFDTLPKKKAHEVWNKAIARCRQKVRLKKKQKKWFKKHYGVRLKMLINQMLVTTTPEGYRATYDLFEKKSTKLEGSRLIRLSTYENAHNLTPGYIKNLENSYSSNLIKAYLRGVFMNLEANAVYESFDRKKNDSGEITPHENEPIRFGMDFNVRNMAAVGHVVRQGNPVAFTEFIGLDDTPRMIEAIKDKYPDHPITIYPDASGASNKSTDASKSDISLLKEAGFIVKAPNKNPRIKDRVNSMNVAFEGKKDYKYYINTSACPKYTESLEQQIYGKDGMPEKDKDLDHPNDASGYYINFDFGVTKPVTNILQIPV